MNIYLLRRTTVVQFEEMSECVVVAPHEEAARQLAAAAAGSEGARVWLSPIPGASQATSPGLEVLVLGTAFPHVASGVVLVDVNYG